MKGREIMLDWSHTTKLKLANVPVLRRCWLHAEPKNGAHPKLAQCTPEIAEVRHVIFFCGMEVLTKGVLGP